MEASRQMHHDEQGALRGKVILITGGAGFIGSHLSEALLTRGHEVTIIDDLSTGRFENVSALTANPHFHFAIETITNAAVMDRLVSECDIVYHLAAAVGVDLIVSQPIHTLLNGFRVTVEDIWYSITG